MRYIFLLCVLLVCLHVINATSIAETLSAPIAVTTHSIRLIAGAPPKIEVIGKTKDGGRKYVLSDAIPKGSSDLAIRLVCREIALILKRKQASLLWIGRLYIVYANNTKKAILLKNLIYATLKNVQQDMPTSQNNNRKNQKKTTVNKKKSAKNKNNAP